MYVLKAYERRKTYLKRLFFLPHTTPDDVTNVFLSYYIFPAAQLNDNKSLTVFNSSHGIFLSVFLRQAALLLFTTALCLTDFILYFAGVLSVIHSPAMSCVDNARQCPAGLFLLLDNGRMLHRDL